MSAPVQSTTPGSLVGRGRAVALIVSAVLFACNQDEAASNAERETHMGSVRAAAPAPTDSAPAMAHAAPPAAAPPVGSGGAPAGGSASAVPLPSPKKEKP
jgi:hypothetical protein